MAEPSTAHVPSSHLNCFFGLFVGLRPGSGVKASKGLGVGPVEEVVLQCAKNGTDLRSGIGRS